MKRKSTRTQQATRGAAQSALRGIASRQTRSSIEDHEPSLSSRESRHATAGRKGKQETSSAVRGLDSRLSQTSVSKRSKKSEQSVCEECRSIDFASIFDMDATSIAREGTPIADLGSRLSADSTCSVCRFLHLMRYPRDSVGFVYHLRAFSFFQNYSAVGIKKMPKKIREKDGICLAVIPGLLTSSVQHSKRYSLQQHYSHSGHILQADACPSNHLAFSGRRLGQIVDYSLIRFWIDYCQTHHAGLCAKSSPLVQGLKLIDCVSRSVVRATDTDRYCALSYVWGPHASDSHQDLITVDDKKVLPPTLPLVLEDAIQATTRLGFQYLWIDQYCIDQANHTEKHQQIQQMDSIYARAEITIIAAAGVDQDYGLPGVSTTTRRAQPQTEVNGIQLVSTLGDPRNSIKDSKWSTRGWTYQEAVISRRRVVFTDSQVYFECNQMNCCESVHFSLDLMHRRDKSAFFHFMRSGIFSGSAGHSEFASFNAHHNTDPDSVILKNYVHIENYAARELSYESDTIRAFAGIMNYMSREGSYSHLCGLPYKSDLLASDLDPSDPRKLETAMSLTKSLAWFHGSPRVRRKPEFPSWSWAGWASSPRFWYAIETLESSKRDIQYRCYLDEIKLTDESGLCPQREETKDFSGSLGIYRYLSCVGRVLIPAAFTHFPKRHRIDITTGVSPARRSNTSWMMSEPMKDYESFHSDLQAGEIKCLFVSGHGRKQCFLVIQSIKDIAYKIGTMVFDGELSQLEDPPLLEPVSDIRLG